MRRALAIASVVCEWVVGGWSRPVLAGGGAATDAYDDIAVSGSLDAHVLGDVYSIYNFDNPASGINQIRAFDFRDRPSLGYLVGTLALRPAPVGFRLDAGFGSTADVFRREDPALAGHPTWARATSYVGQGFFTVMLPYARPVELDAGKFSTPVGLEDNESLPNWNYSRSLLFTWAEPTLNTGLRATCQLTDVLALSVFWVNGWNAGVLDGSDMRTLAAAATWKPRDRIDVAFVDMAGLEHPPTALTGPLSFRNLADAYVVIGPWNNVSFALTADAGYDRAQGGVDWWGASGYTRVQFLGWAAAAFRGEYLSDPDGFVTGTRQFLYELTTTAEAHGNVGRARFVVRLEYRHDQSTADVFDAALPASRNHQDTITLALMSAF